MATRSRVAVVYPKNFLGESHVRSIYCHYDGYPAGIGVTLQTNYKVLDDVIGLVSLGDAQGVYPSLGEHAEKRSPYVMRGESHCVARHSSVEELLADAGALEEYLYVFDNGVWYAYETRDGRVRDVEIPQY